MARARGRPVGSPEFWLILVLLGIGAAGLRLWTSDRGQAFLVRYGVTRHFLPPLATRVDVALAQRLLEMGLVRGNVRSREVVEGNQRLREYRFAAPHHLGPTRCNLELRRAARSVNADVVRAEEQRARGEQLVLWIGYGKAITHRIVILPPAKPSAAEAARGAPRLALVIDDFGHNLNRTVRGILELPVPFTLAVLPDLPKTRAVLEAARKRGLPALLHLPMQPEGHGNPGKNPVTVQMSPEEIDAVVDRHCRRYPSIVGVNNHMGSRATADLPTMRALMQALRRRELIFVDSQTTPRSQGAKAGREAGVWCLRNDLFLDDKEESAEGVAANLERLARIARKRGLAVGIAHPHPETLAALQAMLPRLRAEGFEFVTVEALRPQARVAAKAGESS